MFKLGLDTGLAQRDDDELVFYHPFNSICALQQYVVLYQDSKAIGCGALTIVDPTTAEVKRMYGIDSEIGKGLTTQILHHLDVWAKELGTKGCMLETGIRQPESIALYEKNGDVQIPNHGQYIGIQNSVCSEKLL